MKNTEDAAETLAKRFKLVCLACDSENVVVHYDPGYHYSEMTWAPASLTIGCNNCKANDWIMS
jgi:hypothetical protein